MVYLGYTLVFSDSVEQQWFSLDGLLHLDKHLNGFQQFMEVQIKVKTIQVSFSFLIQRFNAWSLKSVQWEYS